VAVVPEKVDLPDIEELFGNDEEENE
jgi:hypothetical protein